MKDILIVGTGALACLFAARLSRAGYAIILLGTWPAGLAALRSDGVRLVEADGTQARFPVRATAETRDCAGSRLALVLVKAWQTERAGRQLAECLAQDGLALTIQNGLGNYETLAECLGAERVALGSTTTGATLLGPGQVRPGGEGIVSLGRHPALAPLETALREGGFHVRTVDDPRALIWGKLVVNAAINPLTALLQVPNGELLERPSARALLSALAHETAQVAKAEQISLPFEDPAAAAEEVARKTAANHSSMLQDVLRGAPTEIEAICGAIVRTAEKHGLEVPANRTCWQLVQALEVGAHR